MEKKEVEIIRRTISVLDSVDYNRYSDNKAGTYLEYAAGDWTDERKLISPILFPRFIEEVLDFKLGETIGTQETAPESRDIPDYIPTDIRTHPFVFDCKGMDTSDLSKWYSQIKGYIESQNLTYGVLINMRDLDVYTSQSSEEIPTFDFSFLQLYKDFKNNVDTILENENTKKFIGFVQFFHCTKLTPDKKLERILNAEPWSGTEPLNIELLTGRLHYIVERIHEDGRSRKEELFFKKETDPQTAISITQEIEIIASEIERRRGIREASSAIFEEIIDSPSKSVLSRSLDLFLYRIAYFTMTRILLARTWEDIGFINQTLYDGGLAKWYNNFDKEIHRVLGHTFGLASERYKWLYKVDNNYSWYEPSDETLIEVLYELSNFYLGRIDQDVLGSIYEQYVDTVDKKQKGQYYTPREIVEFIWDRVGYVDQKAFFWHFEGKRVPRFIFDPATGSGGFLVEAARRLRERSGINWDDFQDLYEVYRAILYYIFGCELSVFPYYITQVNLLIQLTPIVKRMIELKKGLKESVALGIVPVDALSLYTMSQLSLDNGQYNLDHLRDLLSLDKQQQSVFKKIKTEFNEKFSYCCANPPYIGEKGNKELFRSTLNRFPHWAEFYQGKMDYLYFFIILGLSKLRDYGKLGFITTSYWPTADGASKLRQYILRTAKIVEIIYFGDVKIFEYAKGQHSMVFMLHKCAGQEREHERAKNRLKIVQVLAKDHEIPGKTRRQKLNFLTQHIQEHIDKSKWGDEYIKVFYSGVRQGELTDGPWDLLSDERIAQALAEIGAKGSPLTELCNVIKGVDTGANCVTSTNIRMVNDESIRLGQGIFILTHAELEGLSLSDVEKSKIKPLTTSEDLGTGILDIVSQPNYLLYVTDEDKLEHYPGIYNHLIRFRGILENRAEISRNPGRKWYALAWARDRSTFEDEKLIVSYRADKNNFVIDRNGYFGLSGLYFISKRTGIHEALEYIMALLNSKLIDYWYEYKGKKKGENREYVGTPINAIPIRRIDFDNSYDIQLYDGIVANAEAIFTKMEKLATYSEYFSAMKLTRIVFEDILPDIIPSSVVQSMPPEQRFSLRTHPDINISHDNDIDISRFTLRKVGTVSLTLEGPQVRLDGKNNNTIFVTGQIDILEVVDNVLENCRGYSWMSIREMPLIPEKAEDFYRQKQSIIEEVSSIRYEIQQHQEVIDNLVCELYGIQYSDLPTGF